MEDKDEEQKAEEEEEQEETELEEGSPIRPEQKNLHPTEKNWKKSW